MTNDEMLKRIEEAQAKVCRVSNATMNCRGRLGEPQFLAAYNALFEANQALHRAAAAITG